ncbi:MAG: UDP-2,4-diacetamido-2,4,6-trideoxy-beta-L-altropyranose hydrolase [Gammaproteobacteria bacterium]
MKIVFRADSSLSIGSGHIMRCLTLAEELRDRGSSCHFICRDHVGNINQMVRERGFALHELATTEHEIPVQALTAPAHLVWLGSTQEADGAACSSLLAEIGADIVVVDHYALDAVWETIVLPYCTRLVVIDDLADRLHSSDVLIDHNLGREPQHYDALVPTGCKLLCGPGYALLRPEFVKLRSLSLARRAGSGLHSITVSMGGVDAPDATSKVLRALGQCVLPANSTICVLMGGTAPLIANVRREAGRLPWKTEVQVAVDNVGEILANSDLVIGAVGGSAWERCALGVPSVMVILAENQRTGALALAEQGAALLLGEVGDIEDRLHGVLASLQEGEMLARLSSAAAALVDGCGVLKVADEILLDTRIDSAGTLRRMAHSDLEKVLQWRNHPDVRQFMYTQQEISWDEHVAWFARSDADPARHLLIYDWQGESAGFASLTVKAGNIADWGFYLAPGSIRGMGSRLGRACLAYAFDELQLHKVSGEVLSFNDSSIRFHDRLGFVREGTLRQHHLTDTGYLDVILYGLLAHEWALGLEKQP